MISGPLSYRAFRETGPWTLNGRLIVKAGRKQGVGKGRVKDT